MGNEEVNKVRDAMNGFAMLYITDISRECSCDVQRSGIPFSLIGGKEYEKASSKDDANDIDLLEYRDIGMCPL